MTRAYEKETNETNELQACQFSGIKQFSVLAHCLSVPELGVVAKIRGPKTVSFSSCSFPTLLPFFPSIRKALAHADPFMSSRKKEWQSFEVRRIMNKMNRREQNQKTS